MGDGIEYEEVRRLDEGLYKSFPTDIVRRSIVDLFSEHDAMAFAEYHVNRKRGFTRKVNTRTVGNSGIDAKPEYQMKLGEQYGLLVLEADLLSMASDGKAVRLYHDNRWGNETPAYFTVNTIPSNYIKIVAEI